MTARALLIGAGSLALLTLLLTTVTSAQEPAPTEEDRAEGLWEQVRRLYEQAREEGEDVPRDVYDWLRSDLQNIGDWEYHVFESAADDSAATVEQRLNELGAERWDCIWIEPRGNATRFVMKRPKRSYLQRVPLSQLLKLIPVSGSGEE